jgi:hypothetical protein
MPLYRQASKSYSDKHASNNLNNLRNIIFIYLEVQQNLFFEIFFGLFANLRVLGF